MFFLCIIVRRVVDDVCECAAIFILGFIEWVYLIIVWLVVFYMIIAICSTATLMITYLANINGSNYLSIIGG